MILQEKCQKQNRNSEREKEEEQQQTGVEIPRFRGGESGRGQKETERKD